VMYYMNLSIDDIKQYMLRAARAAFLPPSEREDLVRQFQGYMAEVETSHD